MFVCFSPECKKTDYSYNRNRTKDGAIEGKLLAVLLLQILLDAFGRIIIFRNNPLLKEAIKYFFRALDQNNHELCQLVSLAFRSPFNIKRKVIRN